MGKEQKMEENGQPQCNEKCYKLVFESLPKFKILLLPLNSPVTFYKLFILILSELWHPHLSNGKNLTSEGCFENTDLRKW